MQDTTRQPEDVTEYGIWHGTAGYIGKRDAHIPFFGYFLRKT